MLLLNANICVSKKLSKKTQCPRLAILLLFVQVPAHSDILLQLKRVVDVSRAWFGAYCLLVGFFGMM